MLPELLFAGNSMQDLSRDDINLLHSACDKDALLATSETTFERLKLGRTPELDATVSIKVEDNAADPFPWHTTNAYIGSNLLRHSDDPLISGAIDDNHNEFEQIASCKALTIASTTGTSTSFVSTASPAMTTSAITSSSSSMSNGNGNGAIENTCNGKKSTRTRKKGQVKLQFHHQAIPHEYLQHYEATHNQNDCKEITIESPTKDKSLFLSDCLDAEQKINDSVQIWLQKINEIQDGKIDTTKYVPITLNAPSVVSQRQRSPTTTNGSGRSAILSSTSASSGKNTVSNVNAVTRKSNRTMNYSDLPYMGEMTLANSKPRRGRKPKKADICHLIYKNYGTILSNQSSSKDTVIDECIADATTMPAPATTSHNSLLEKCLTETEQRIRIEQPLNLCIRDKNDCDITDFDAIENLTENDVDFSLIDSNHALFASPLKAPTSHFQSSLLNNMMSSSSTSVDCVDSFDPLIVANGTSPWTNSNLMGHSMAMYLQKLSDVPSSNLAETYPLIANEITTDRKLSVNETTQKHLIVPKKTSQLMKDEINASSTLQTSTTATASTTDKNQTVDGTVKPKRKRSAIFIPPVPEESSTNHATEVSICKFKFTGGAKPSLQEKKMLSVDAGGNFRYYSGTGDKSIRGYEFFPRETLQQSSLSAASSAGAFLNAAGQKISTDLPPSSMYLASDLMQMHSNELKLRNASTMTTASTTTTTTMTPVSTTSNLLSHVGSSAGNGHSSRRKRRSKRSMQREKLEKTFKEKGFLIQTQQLESAEGATYCKFRQLRKFTRYLFRSWKDYLPGELQQNQSAQNSILPNAIAMTSSMPVTAAAAAVIDAESTPSTSNYLPTSSVASFNESMERNRFKE